MALANFGPLLYLGCAKATSKLYQEKSLLSPPPQKNHLLLGMAESSESYRIDAFCLLMNDELISFE